MLEGDRLRLRLLDPDLLVEKNELKEITNPATFRSGKIPTDDGLLSDSIFGISSVDRGGTFAYIDLHDYYMHPLAYKIWAQMDKNIKEVAYGNKNFIITEEGYLEENEDGETGLEFIRKNIDRINIKPTGSSKRDMKIRFINKNKKNLFIKKCIVIPAYYRDVNTNDDGPVGIGEINKLYVSLLRTVRSIEEVRDYAFDMSLSVQGRVQDTIEGIYDWFVQEPNLAKKDGMIRRSILSKTTDYSSRLVISAPDTSNNRPEDIMVTPEYAAVPLSSLCANFYPFLMNALQTFFQNEFSTLKYPYDRSKKKDGSDIVYIDVLDPDIHFSEENLKKQVSRFIKGFSNRFTKIEVPNKQGYPVYMRFKGRNVSVDDIKEPGNTPLLDRPMTWCDLFFILMNRIVEDKHILITRFPLENYMGQVPAKIRVLSTRETEPMFVNNTHYKWYPKIRESDINSNTSDTFVDTLRMSNQTIKEMGGDYDGDQVSVKGVFSTEANAELHDYIMSKTNFISIAGENVRISSNEAVQAAFCLTRVVDMNKLSNPIF